MNVLAIVIGIFLFPFIIAFKSLQGVVDDIKEDGWGSPTPRNYEGGKQHYLKNQESRCSEKEQINKGV